MTVAVPMRSISSADNPPGAACTLRGKGFFNDRGVLHAEASRRRRDQKFALLGARRRIAVANEAPAETPDDGEDDASPTTRRLRHWKAQKQLLKVGAPKQRAPFRPPSRDPSPLPAPPEYASFRQRHLRYYDSIRHTFISNTSSVGGDRHANCKTSHAASQNSERPPWDDSTQVSFAPAGFQFQCQAPGSKLIATRAACKSGKAKATEVKPNTRKDASGAGTAAQPKQGPLQLPDFSFLFEPVRFSLLFPAKKVNKTEAKASDKKGALATVDNTWSATQNTLLGGSRQQDVPHKDSIPDVGTQYSTHSNASFKQRQADLCSPPEDKENLGKCGYNLRRTKLSTVKK